MRYKERCLQTFMSSIRKYYNVQKICKNIFIGQPLSFYAVFIRCKKSWNRHITLSTEDYFFLLQCVSFCPFPKLILLKVWFLIWFSTFWCFFENILFLTILEDKNRQSQMCCAVCMVPTKLHITDEIIIGFKLSSWNPDSSVQLDKKQEA